MKCLIYYLIAEDTPLRDHATLVKRLARSAYSDLPETHQRSYTLTDFLQSLNDMGLHHQLQARGVISLEDALQVGEDYLRARRLYTEETKGTRVTTKAVQSLGDEMDRLSNLLKQVAKTPNHGTDTAGCPNGLCGTPPVSGRYRDGPVDLMGNGNRSCYHSPTASASYRKRSRPARSIWTSEGSQTPLRLRSGSNQATNGYHPV